MKARYLEQLTRVYSPATWEVYADLNRSLEPLGPQSLLKLAIGLLRPGDRVLDAGCRDATHLVELLQATMGTTGVGVEPVASPLEQARRILADAALGDRAGVVQGSVHQLSMSDGQVDPLLRNHGGNVYSNLDRSRLETAFAAAGILIEQVDEIGTQWREYAEERTQPVSRKLLQLARLRRRWDQLVTVHGLSAVKHVEANLHWEVFQFLGKLLPIVYTLRKRETP